MQNVKIENWEKWDICYLRLSPVKEDAKGIPLEDKAGEPVLDIENAAVVCALPQMRISRTVGIYSSIWQKIRSVFNPLLKELIDTVKYTKKLLRGVSSKSSLTSTCQWCPVLPGSASQPGQNWARSVQERAQV